MDYRIGWSAWLPVRTDALDMVPVFLRNTLGACRVTNLTKRGRDAAQTTTVTLPARQTQPSSLGCAAASTVAAAAASTVAAAAAAERPSWERALRPGSLFHEVEAGGAHRRPPVPATSRRGRHG